MADNLPVDRLLVNAHHYILYPQSAHQRPEHAGLTGTVTTKQSGYHSGL